MKSRKTALITGFIAVLFPVCAQSVGRSSILIPYNVQKIARVTGNTEAGESLPNPNQTAQKYDVGGTDLGIGWDMGNGVVGWWFGDTYGKSFTPQPQGGPANNDNWRSNVLAFSHDGNLEDGLLIDSMVVDNLGHAKELIYGAKNTTGEGDWTSIPTAAVRVGNVDYIHYMNIRKWLEAGNWSTNYSAVYRSSDSGKNWSPTAVRFDARSNFSQVGFAKKDGYVYMIGTRPGRLHPAYLCRIPEAEMENKEKYAYWNAEKGWLVNEELSATPIVQDGVGELSLLYHTGFKRWIMTYMNEKKYSLLLRSASCITGPWSEPVTLAEGKEYPGLYGAFMYPLKNDGNILYFLMSQWKPYNVFLMRANLKLE